MNVIDNKINVISNKTDLDQGKDLQDYYFAELSSLYTKALIYNKVFGKSLPNQDVLYLKNTDKRFFESFDKWIQYQICSQIMNVDLLEKLKEVNKDGTQWITKRLKLENAYKSLVLSIGTTNGESNPGRIIFSTNFKDKIVSHNSYKSHRANQKEYYNYINDLTNARDKKNISANDIKDTCEFYDLVDKLVGNTVKTRTEKMAKDFHDIIGYLGLFNCTYDNSNGMAEFNEVTEIIVTELLNSTDGNTQINTPIDALVDNIETILLEANVDFIK